jgi:S1-C subfamily serine protease
MKNVFCFATALLLCVTAQGQQVPVSDLERSVVQVVVRHADGSAKAFGTAFLVRDDGTLATVNHVYADAIAYIAQLRDGAVAVRRMSRAVANTGLLANVDLVSTDNLHDIVLLRIHDFNRGQWDAVGGLAVATITERPELPTGSNLTFVGYFSDDLFPESLPAILAGTATLTVAHTNGNLTVEEFLTSSSAWPGHSGSPVFFEGKVIGLVDSMIMGAVPLNSQPLHAGMNRVVKGEHLGSLISPVR